MKKRWNQFRPPRIVRGTRAVGAREFLVLLTLPDIGFRILDYALIVYLALRLCPSKREWRFIAGNINRLREGEARRSVSNAPLITTQTLFLSLPHFLPSERRICICFFCWLAKNSPGSDSILSVGADVAFSPAYRIDFWGNIGVTSETRIPIYRSVSSPTGGWGSKFVASTMAGRSNGIHNYKRLPPADVFVFCSLFSPFYAVDAYNSRCTFENPRQFAPEGDASDAQNQAGENERVSVEFPFNNRWLLATSVLVHVCVTCVGCKVYQTVTGRFRAFGTLWSGPFRYLSDWYHCTAIPCNYAG